MWRISRSNSIIRWQDYRVPASRLAESNFRHTQVRARRLDTARTSGSLTTPVFRPVQQIGCIVSHALVRGLHRQYVGT